jgi:hypothetical protein
MIWYVIPSSTGNFYGAQWGLSTDFTAPGDYDGDGKFDFAIQRPGATPTSQATFYINTSSNGGMLVYPWGWSKDMVVPGDYDGDGKTDVAVVREGDTPTSQLVWWILKSSDGGVAAYAFGTTGTDIDAQADYDGDGRTDPAIWRETDGNFYILRSTDGRLDVVHWGSANDFPIAGYDTH